MLKFIYKVLRGTLNIIYFICTTYISKGVSLGRKTRVDMKTDQATIIIKKMFRITSKYPPPPTEYLSSPISGVGGLHPRYLQLL